MKPLFLITPLVATLALSNAGCGRDAVKVYQVESPEAVLPQAKPLAAAAPMSMGDLPPTDNSGLPKVKAVLPAGWREKPLTQLRVASYAVGPTGQEADVSVIPLTGKSGGDLANVNRWRGQVGLPQISENELAATAEPVTIAGRAAALYDLVGVPSDSGPQTRILGAILPDGETAWFFKMTGASELVAAEKNNFIALLKSVEFLPVSAANVSADLSQLPPSHPPIGGAPAAAGSLPQWRVPADWQPVELTQFLVARFRANGANGAAAFVNVSRLDSDGGGVAANVNRWRSQLGLAPASAEEIAALPTISIGGTAAVVADATGTDAKTGQPARLVGVVLARPQQSWFFKLMGDASVVAEQKSALLQFIQSAEYPHAN